MKIELVVTDDTSYVKLKNNILVTLGRDASGCLCSSKSSCFIINKESQNAYISSIKHNGSFYTYEQIFKQTVNRDFYRRMKFPIDKI